MTVYCQLWVAAPEFAKPSFISLVLGCVPLQKLVTMLRLLRQDSVGLSQLRSLVVGPWAVRSMHCSSACSTRSMAGGHQNISDTNLADLCVGYKRWTALLSCSQSCVTSARQFHSSTLLAAEKRSSYLPIVEKPKVQVPLKHDTLPLKLGPRYPRVLFHDPWPTTKMLDDKQRLAKLLYKMIKEEALSSQELFAKFQSMHKRPFYTRGMFKDILTYLKEYRFIWTQANPKTKTGSPRLFVAYDFQQVKKGSQDIIQAKLAENAAKYRETTIKRCRNKKPGVPIERRQSLSCFVTWEAGFKAKEEYERTKI